MKNSHYILAFAFRYALTRRTSAMNIVLEELRKIEDELEEWELLILIEDCIFQARLNEEDEVIYSQIKFAQRMLEGILQQRREEKSENEN